MLTIKKASERLRISRGTLKQAIKNGQIKVEKIGKRDYVPEGEIIRLEQEKK